MPYGPHSTSGPPGGGATSQGSGRDYSPPAYGPGTYGSKRGRPPAKKKKKLTKKQRRNPGKLKKDDPRYIALKKKGLV